MPRYTSLQTFSDQVTKKVQVPSSGADGGAAPSGSGASNSTKDQVFNVRSSNAGASSSAFHVYRQARSREMSRLEALEEEDKRQKEREELSEKVAANKAEADDKTAKNAAKRRKRKQTQQAVRQERQPAYKEGNRGGVARGSDHAATK